MTVLNLKFFDYIHNIEKENDVKLYRGLFWPLKHSSSMKKSDYKFKKFLAIDYGRKFTGLASFKVDVDPFPLLHGRIAYKDDEQLALDIQEIIDEEFVDYIVLGIPYFTDGTSSTMTKTVEAFADLLSSKVGIEVFRADETLTTFEAEERMKSDPRFNFKVDMTQIDAMSALIILEEFVKNFSDGS